MEAEGERTVIRCEVTMEVARPVRDVFGFVDDVGKAPQWSATRKQVEGDCAKLVELLQTQPDGRAANRAPAA